MSFAVIAVSALVAGVAIQAYGQYQAGQAAEAEGEAAQQLANSNAKLAERQAEAERKRSVAEAERFEREGEALQGQQKVKLAKGGVLANQDTPMLVLEETALALESDRMSILREGFMAESLRKSEAENLKFEGRAYKAKGQNLATAAKYRATGTILTGVGMAAGAAKSLSRPSGGGGSPASFNLTTGKVNLPDPLQTRVEPIN